MKSSGDRRESAGPVSEARPVDRRRHGNEAVAATQSARVLFEIIMRRYETRSTMMTSNRPLEDWGKLIGDVPSATAILDRFLHHAEIVTITGKSYRLRNQAQPVAPAEEPKPAKMHAGIEGRGRRTKTDTTESSVPNQAAEACQP